jgi:hypothetical protein
MLGAAAFWLVYGLIHNRILKRPLGWSEESPLKYFWHRLVLTTVQVRWQHAISVDTMQCTVRSLCWIPLMSRAGHVLSIHAFPASLLVLHTAWPRCAAQPRGSSGPGMWHTARQPRGWYRKTLILRRIIRLNVLALNY